MEIDSQNDMAKKALEQITKLNPQEIESVGMIGNRNKRDKDEIQVSQIRLSIVVGSNFIREEVMREARSLGLDHIRRGRTPEQAKEAGAWRTCKIECETKNEELSGLEKLTHTWIPWNGPDGTHARKVLKRKV